MVRVICAHCGKESWEVDTSVPGVYEFNCTKRYYFSLFSGEHYKYYTQVRIYEDGTIKTEAIEK
jgi:hypothetical protein